MDLHQGQGRREGEVKGDSERVVGTLRSYKRLGLQIKRRQTCSSLVSLVARKACHVECEWQDRNKKNKDASREIRNELMSLVVRITHDHKLLLI